MPGRKLCQAGPRVRSRCRGSAGGGADSLEFSAGGATGNALVTASVVASAGGGEGQPARVSCGTGSAAAAVPHISRRSSHRHMGADRSQERASVAPNGVIVPCRAPADGTGFAAVQHEIRLPFRQTARMAATMPLHIQQPRVNAAALKRALIAGVQQVLSQREAIDRINVFPVPDGDTGSNMAFTLHAVMGGALSAPAPHCGLLMRRVADDAIDGARGNSGAILAQFLQGVGETVDGEAVLTPAELARAVRRGAQQARQALSEPREGTILSVISAFADALDERASSGAVGLRRWFEQAVVRARRALSDTPKQLAVLRQAGVVDAGALGFVELIEGIHSFLLHGRAVRTLAAVPDEGFDVAGHAELEFDPLHRFCTECLVEGDAIDRSALRHAVEALGAGSVVVAGSLSRARIHAHLGEPQQLFELAAGFGRVSGQKAEDMHAQHAAAASEQRVAIAVDSGADFPDDWILQHGLQVVPVRVSFGAEDFLDKVGLSTAAFYRRLRSGGELPKTSQPPPGDFRRRFESSLSHKDAVLYVGLSSALSGTLQSGEGAAQRVDAARVRVFDTLNASCGQGLLALAAAEAAARGESVEAILATLDHLRGRTHTFACARDIAHAVRGGRVPRWIGPLARFAGLTPIAAMKPEGRLAVAGALLGRRRVAERFAAWVARRVPKGVRWRLLVGHCDASADAALLADALQTRLDCAQSWVVEAGPAIGAHAGPGALVVALQEHEAPA